MRVRTTIFAASLFATASPLKAEMQPWAFYDYVEICHSDDIESISLCHGFTYGVMHGFVQGLMHSMFYMKYVHGVEVKENSRILPFCIPTETLIDDVVYAAFEHALADEDSLKENAAHILKDVLTKNYPCR